MTQYNSLNVKLSNSQLNKLKSAIRNKTEVVLRLSSNTTGDDETNFHNQQQTQKYVKILRSGHRPSSSTSHNNNITLIISNDETKDIIKIVKFHEDSSLLPEGNGETIQNEAKERRGGFISMLLGTLGASLLGNILAGKGKHRTGEGNVRTSYGNKKGQKARKKKDKIIKTKCIFNAALSFN